jgi:hyperpolarization activated cyclic nucleotide-gated potassium channel 2
LAWSEGITIREVESDDSLSGVSNTPQLLKLLKIAKLLKMLKLLRVMKISKIISKFNLDEVVVSDSIDLIATFMNITYKLIIVAHYMACLMFYSGMLEIRSSGQGWLL